MDCEIDTVVFDLDGTICRYKRSPQELLELSFDELGVGNLFSQEEYISRIPEFADESESMSHLREMCFVDLAKEKGESRKTGEKLAEAFEKKRDHSRVEFMDGAGEALEFLDENGYKLGLVTNGHPDMQGQKIESLGISGLFEKKVFAGHETEGKPDPEPFEKVLDGLGSKASDSVFVGDSVEGDVGGAQNVGMKTAWVEGGFDPGRLEEKDEDPDYVLESVRDLIPILDGE